MSTPLTAFIVALAVVAVCAWAPGLVLPAAAAGIRDDLFDRHDDNLFGWDEDDLFRSNEDDLFGGSDLIVESVTTDRGRSLADELLVSDGIRLGGTYNVGLNSEWPWSALSGGESGAVDGARSTVSFGGTVYADARPSKDLRLFAKARLDGGGPLLEVSRIKLKAKLTEAFADFHSDNRVFFRAGKQRIHWGVGYFFSPADIINIGRIDPEHPEADREGPVALKANMPVGSDNYYVHVIADSVAGRTMFALAPKAEWVVGGTEIGLGAYYREDRAPRGMVTMSGSVGKVALFGEGVVSYGSDKRFLQADTAAPLGVKAVRKDEQVFTHATVGMRHSWSDPDGRYNITGALQYYFNGEGYPDGVFQGFRNNNAVGVAALLAAGELSPADFVDTGRHYAALSLTWIEAYGSRFSPGLFWLGNLQDNSGMVSVSLGVKTWEKVRLSLGANHTYGAKGSEYAPFGSATTLVVTVGFAGSF